MKVEIRNSQLIINGQHHKEISGLAADIFKAIDKAHGGNFPENCRGIYYPGKAIYFECSGHCKPGENCAVSKTSNCYMETTPYAPNPLSPTPYPDAPGDDYLPDRIILQNVAICGETEIEVFLRVEQYCNIKGRATWSVQYHSPKCGVVLDMMPVKGLCNAIGTMKARLKTEDWRHAETIGGASKSKTKRGNK